MFNPDKTYHITVTLAKLDGWGFATVRPVASELGAFVVPCQLVKKFCHFLGIPALGVAGSEYELPVYVSPGRATSFGMKTVVIRADFEGLSWEVSTDSASAALH